ncbi:MAG TPA: hypothetical protein VFQ61_07035 [Polyangiaceae bacterium]|nr:hypothetical protein [Polyangiaceae bacterium]
MRYLDRIRGAAGALAVLAVGFAALAVNPREASVTVAQAASGSGAVDRTIVRFYTPDTGGVRRPHFVYERVLAFEARLEALSDPDRRGDVAYRSRHVNQALERHVAETVLASLHIDPEPRAGELLSQTQAARARLAERVGGEEALEQARAAEGIGERDLLRILQRQARASLYLDRMVAPMLEPTEHELRALHKTRKNPFAALPYERIAPGLRRWYVSQRLATALQAYYQNARSRIQLTLLGDLPER